MKKTVLSLFFTTLINFGSLYSYNITTLFFDVETIFKTDSMRASSYVGKIDSLRYLSQIGHLPCQEDLFNHLKQVKAQSKQVTYNNNLEMPLIFSDWLATLQPSTQIKDIIKKYFQNKNLSDIEIKVLLSIVSMMLTPQHLADTQKIRPKIDQILSNLQRKNLKIYLVGNWAHVQSLKQEFPEIFKYFNGTFVSGDIHLLKPSQQYYQHILKATGLKPDTTLWVESEPRFIAQARQLNYHVIAYKSDDHQSLIKDLRNFGINL